MQTEDEQLEEILSVPSAPRWTDIRDVPEGTLLETREIIGDPTHDMEIEADELSARGTVAGLVVLLVILLSACLLWAVLWLDARGPQ